jgi:hypothetical protein
VPDHHQAIEPNMPGSLGRFVAGTFKLDRADLNAPLNDTISQRGVPNKASPGDFDISDTASRHSNIMRGGFYSLNANTTAYNPNV